MTMQSSASSMSRRTALTGLGVGALGASLGAVHHVSAQDATPSAMATHPIIGTWIIDRDITTATEAPSIVVVTADGGVIDPSQGVAGAWRVTGSRTVEWTLVGTHSGEWGLRRGALYTGSGRDWYEPDGN